MNSLFSKLRLSVDILAADNSTPVLSGVAAGFEELSGRELLQAQALNSETTVLVTVRWNAAIRSSCFVSFGGATYPVLYVRDPGKMNPDMKKGEIGRGQLLELYAHRISDGVST